MCSTSNLKMSDISEEKQKKLIAKIFSVPGKLLIESYMLELMLIL